MNDLISVIVPVYNVNKYIRKCVDSIIEQTYTNLEIILVDDGSTDGAEIICDEYSKNDKRIKVIHKPNGGLSEARNVGIDIANGKYISFIDSDDYVENNYIELLYKSIKKNDADISVSSYMQVYNDGKKIDKSTGRVACLDSETSLYKMLYNDEIGISAWAKLYKIELFKQIRYPKGKLFEDVSTTYKLFDIAEKISVCSEPTYNYMIRNNSITNKNFEPQKMDLIELTQMMCEDIKSKYPKLENACDRRLMYAHLAMLSEIANSKNKFLKEQKKIMKYINENRSKVLKIKELPELDKLSLISTKFGFIGFKILCNLYMKISGRKNI